MPHARILSPSAGKLAALAAVMLAGCVADPAAAPPSAAKAGNPLLEPVQMQEYVPGGGTATRRSASSGQTAAQTQNEAQAQGDGQAPSAPSTNRRRGSGTAPDLLAPPSVPAGPTTVQPKSTTNDTARFKRDLLQPGVTEMQRQDSLGRLDPFQQRDLFNKQHELHRLETDPLRR